MSFPEREVQRHAGAGAGARSALVIAILCVLQVADGIDQSALSFTAPFVRHELGIGVESLGAAFSAGYVGTALGAVLFGTLADRVGRKFALCFAAIAFSLGSLCTIFVHNGGELLAVRLFTGLALGGLFPVVAALILETVSERARATTVTLVSVGTAAGVRSIWWAPPFRRSSRCSRSSSSKVSGGSGRQPAMSATGATA